MRQRDRGFILVAVLAMLVVLALVAAAVALASERAVREAQANADAFAAEVAMIGTRDTLLFLLTTQRQTFGGLTVDREVVWSVGQATASAPSGGDDEFGGLPPPLPIGNEIRMDGTAYRGLEGSGFALQDSGGLFSPNWTLEPYRQGFFSLLEVPMERWAGMEAKRLDYQDPDDLHRLEGAEDEQYSRAGLPPPSNRPIATPLEVRRILGWNEALADRGDDELASLLTTARNVMINVNTAPADVLRTLPGVDEDKAQRMVDLRRTSPFALVWQFTDAFDLPLDEFAPITLLGAGNGTLRLWHNTGGPVRLIHWTLTPIDEGGRPWRLDYEIVLPRDDASDAPPPRAVASPLLAEPDPAGA